MVVRVVLDLFAGTLDVLAGAVHRAATRRDEPEQDRGEKEEREKFVFHRRGKLATRGGRAIGRTTGAGLLFPRSPIAQKPAAMLKAQSTRSYFNSPPEVSSSTDSSNRSSSASR